MGQGPHWSKAEVGALGALAPDKPIPKNHQGYSYLSLTKLFFRSIQPNNIGP